MKKGSKTVLAVLILCALTFTGMRYNEHLRKIANLYANVAVIETSLTNDGTLEQNGSSAFVHLALGTGGTNMTYMGCADATFTNATVATATLSGVTTGDDCFVSMSGWESCSVDPGKTVYQVNTGGIQVTTTNATTGVLKVIVFE